MQVVWAIVTYFCFWNFCKMFLPFYFYSQTLLKSFFPLFRCICSVILLWILTITMRIFSILLFFILVLNLFLFRLVLVFLLNFISLNMHGFGFRALGDFLKPTELKIESVKAMKTIWIFAASKSFSWHWQLERSSRK